MNQPEGFWTQPAELFVHTEIVGGPARERKHVSGNLNWLLEMALHDNPVAIARIVIRNAAGDVFGPAQIRELADEPSRPKPRLT